NTRGTITRNNGHRTAARGPICVSFPNHVPRYGFEKQGVFNGTIIAGKATSSRARRLDIPLRIFLLIFFYRLTHLLSGCNSYQYSLGLLLFTVPLDIDVLIDIKTEWKGSNACLSNSTDKGRKK